MMKAILEGITTMERIVNPPTVVRFQK